MSKNTNNFAHLESTKRVIGQLNTNSDQKNSYNPLPVILVILLMGIGGYFLYDKYGNNSETSQTKTDESEQININDNTAEIDETDTQAEPEQLPDEVQDEVPSANTLYLVKEASGEYSIFITNENLAYYYDEESSDNVADESYGLLGQGNYNQALEVDFKEFEESIRLITLPTEYIVDEYFKFVDHMLTSDGRDVYISFISEEGEEPDIIQRNALLHVDLRTKTGDFVWERQLGDESYEEYLGAITLDDIVEKYLVVNMLECYGCALESPSSTVIINLSSGDDILVGEATNLVFDTESGMISFDQDGDRKELSLP
jgi:hypothetical protein